MKHIFSLAAALTLGAGSMVAATAVTDTVVTLAEVEVLATRADAATPVAYTNVTAKQLQVVNHGLDLPFLLSNTPGVVTTSDAGAGVGYTSLRIRGTDATRINVTANDIPMNDSESQTVFWVNTPDLATSLADVQLQRGVGTSTYGAGAFGGAVNMRTQRFSSTPYASFSGSYGSFNTNKETVTAGTGLLSDHWCVDLRLSHIGSDGYRDRATSELFSYFAQIGWFNPSTSVRFITFAGSVRTLTL